MAFKIADGYVEVHGRLDESSFRRAAKQAGDRAGRDAGDHFETAFSKSADTHGFSSEAFDGIERSSSRAGDRAGSRFTRGFRDNLRKEGKGRLFNSFRELFEADESRMGSLLHPLETILSRPIVAIVAAGIVSLGAGAIAAALSSAVMLGIGGLVVGGAAALLSKKLKPSFQRAKNTIVSTLRGAAAPLQDEFVQAFRDIALWVKQNEGLFNALFKAAQPLIPILVDIFKQFGDEILPTIVANMPAIVDLFKVLADRSPEIADSISRLLQIMSDEDTITAFGYLLTGLITTIDLTADAIGGLTRSFNNDIETIKEGIYLATGVIDGLKNALKGIKRKVITDYLFKPGHAFSQIAKLIGRTKAIPKAWHTFYMFMWRGGASALLTRAYNWVRRIPKSWKTVYNFLIGGELGDIAKVVRALGAIPRSVSTTFTSVTRNITESITRFMNPFANAHGGIIGSQGMATGGVVGARQVLVGEHGPELATLPFGSRVTPAGQTRAQLGAGGGSGQVVLEVHPGGGALDDLFFQWLRKGIRSRGGDVQVVLGR